MFSIRSRSIRAVYIRVVLRKRMGGGRGKKEEEKKKRERETYVRYVFSPQTVRRTLDFFLLIPRSFHPLFFLCYE